MQNFLFYGTLRKNGDKLRTYNFNRFGKGSQTYLKTVKLKFWKLISLRYFPCVIEGDENDEIVAELHEVTDGAAQEISYMELDSGYSYKTVPVEYNGETILATIFYHDRKLRPEDTQILSGDWCNP